MSEPIYFIEKIESLVKNRTFQRETAQIRARALLKEVTGDIPEYDWNYSLPRLVRLSTAVKFGLDILTEEMPEVMENLQNDVKQFALLWESLAKLGEGIQHSSALLNSALAYEIAGYQANASCLAKKLGHDLFITKQPSVINLTSAFLQRYLIEVIRLSKIAKENIKFEEEITSDYFRQISLGIAGEGFEKASMYFLTGEGSYLEEAISIFEKAEKIYSSLGYILEPNIIRSIKSILKLMKIKSTWNILQNYIEDNDYWNRYLKLLSRGIGFPINEAHSISELWPSQITALENDLLSASSKMIKMPTSAGKTRIAEIAMIHSLIINENSKCIYIAPYRALVTELEQSFLNIFGDMGYRISSLRGAYETDDFEDVLTSDADILVLTPEKLDLVLRAQPEFLENVRLFVLDEGQIIRQKRRGVKFELLLTRLKTKLPNARFLFISAVIPTKTLVDFANWFNADPTGDVITSDWRPSIQRVAKFHWMGNVGSIQYVDTEDLEILQEFVTGIIISKQYKYRHPLTRAYRRPTFPKVEKKSQIAAELAYKFAELGSVLIYCPKRKLVNSVGKELETRLEISTFTDERIPDCFGVNENRPSVLSAKEWLGEDHLVTRLLKRGIAIHHGDIPEIVRNSIERDFRDKLLNVIIATTTLAQGINLPIKTVIIHSCWIYEEGYNRPITAIDYWNIAGRAGRAGRETEGTIIHIILNDKDEELFNYYLEHRREVEPMKSALYQLLCDLVDERLSETALEEKLDPEILAILVEEQENILTLDGVQNLLNETLVQIQSTDPEYDINRLKMSIFNTASKISEKVTDTNLLSIYSATGLSTRSCIEITNKINEDRDYYKDLFCNGDTSRFQEILDSFLKICIPIIEMDVDDASEFNDEMLISWINGLDINAIISKYKDVDTTVEELVKYISNFYSYRLPWGMTAVIKIASNVLELESAISEYCLFFPTMVKYGVPSPEASWVMSFGIPSRNVGIKIARQYILETTAPGFQDYLDWFSNIDLEILSEKFNLEGPILTDISRLLQRSYGNPLLKENPNAQKLLPIETNLKGVFMGNREAIAIKAGVGAILEIKRDYYNTLDRNAIFAAYSDEIIGYLDRNVAQVIAPDIDCGLLIMATITEIEKGSVESTSNIKIKLELTDLDMR